MILKDPLAEHGFAHSPGSELGSCGQASLPEGVVPRAYCCHVHIAAMSAGMIMMSILVGACPGSSPETLITASKGLGGVICDTWRPRFAKVESRNSTGSGRETT